MELNKFIDHTLLKAVSTSSEIAQLCSEAKEFNFFSVCVNPSYIEEAKENLKDSSVKIAAVIGFPLGAMSSDAKVFEAKDAINKGADEIDMVLNVGYMKSGYFQKVEDEIRDIKNAIGSKVLKVILETCYLNRDEIKKACELAINAKADFVKTSTGFGTGGATFEDVELMKSVVEGKAEIKASGGVRDVETATKYIEMGVTRLGTSSGVKLMTTGEADPNQY